LRPPLHQHSHRFVCCPSINAIGGSLAPAAVPATPALFTFEQQHVNTIPLTRHHRTAHFWTFVSISVPNASSILALLHLSLDV
jgi:hypothetical protein